MNGEEPGEREVDGLEPEPEDEAGEREADDQRAQLCHLDDKDDPDHDDEPPAAFEIPDGFVQADEPPTDEQLAFQFTD